MAHTAALITTLGQLADSLFPRNTSTSHPRRIKDLFTKQARTQIYARTNQFEVDERLDGLEEKFQIFDRDDLSDALLKNRNELRQHHISWTPDVLNLLLHLSNDPLTANPSDNIHRVERLPQVPLALKWSDIEAENPFDKQDPIWRQQDLSDLSSEDESYVENNSASKPGSPSKKAASTAISVRQVPFIDQKSHLSHLAHLLETQSRRSECPLRYTELQAIRETLFMLQGFQTSIYLQEADGIVAMAGVEVTGISSEMLSDMLEAFAVLGSEVDAVRKWTGREQKLQYMRNLQTEVAEVVSKFDACLSEVNERMLNPRGSVIVSIASVREEIDGYARSLVDLGPTVKIFERSPGPAALDALYEYVCGLQAVPYENTLVETKKMFISALQLYLRPVLLWLNDGCLDPHYDEFFIERNAECRNPSMLWSDWYSVVRRDSEHRTPDFLERLTSQIFAAGKTRSFLRELNQIPADSLNRFDSDGVLQELLQESDGLIPFSEHLQIILQEIVAAKRSQSTALLKTVLEKKCGLTNTLSTLNHLYFARNGPLTDAMDAKIFSRVDRCNELWNDRYIIAELLEEVFHSTDIDLNRLVVHSQHTSARKMASRRQSVKLLGDLSVEYVLPWPLANIISPSIMSVVRRVSLLLFQLRRARYLLLRRAHFFVHSGLLYLDYQQRKSTQALHHELLMIADTVYDHLTTFVITPLIAGLQLKIHEAAEIDDMITAMNDFGTLLEYGCVLSKKLSVIYDSLISLLDLGLRFAEVVSMPTSLAKRKNSDFEASSFISAVSARKGKPGRRITQVDSSDDEPVDADELSEGEGYSSFVVLQETTPSEEVTKIEVQLRKQHTFFVAALSSVATTIHGEEASSWEILAARLRWS